MLTFVSLFGERGIVVVLFDSLYLFHLFVGCFGKCMMGWLLVFVGFDIYKNVVVVVGMGYALSFVVVGVTCIGCSFLSWF